MTTLSGAYRRGTDVNILVSGARGASDYQLWREAGNSGSYLDYLNYLADIVIANNPGFKGDKGDPGGNVMSIGRFVDGSGISIPGGTDTVRTSGYGAAGKGSALYVYDAAVDVAYVTAHPRTSFRTTNGRGFRLSTDQTLYVDMLGAPSDGVGDDTMPAREMLATFGTLRFRDGWSYLFALQPGQSAADGPTPDAAIVLDDGMWIEGRGKLRFPGNGRFIKAVGSNGGILDIEMDGERTVFPSNIAHYDAIFADWRYEANTNFLIKGVKIRRFGGCGILWLGDATRAIVSSGARIEKCHVEYVGAHAIDIQGGIDNQIAYDNTGNHWAQGYPDRIGLVIGRASKGVKSRGNKFGPSLNSVGVSSHAISYDNVEDLDVVGDEGFDAVGAAIEWGFVKNGSGRGLKGYRCRYGFLGSGTQTGVGTGLRNVDTSVQGDFYENTVNDVYVSMNPFTVGVTVDGSFMHENFNLDVTSHKAGEIGVFLNKMRDSAIRVRTVSKAGLSGFQAIDCPDCDIEIDKSYANNVSGSPKVITSLTSAGGSTVTAVSAGHGLVNGDVGIVHGSPIAAYNREGATVTVLDANTFTYAITGNAPPNASFTGSIAGNTLTVSAIGSGYLRQGQTVAGGSMTAAKILSIDSGGGLAGSVCTLDGAPQTVASSAMSADFRNTHVGGAPIFVKAASTAHAGVIVRWSAYLNTEALRGNWTLRVHNASRNGFRNFWEALAGNVRGQVNGRYYIPEQAMQPVASTLAAGSFSLQALAYKYAVGYTINNALRYDLYPLDAISAAAKGATTP